MLDLASLEESTQSKSERRMAWRFEEAGRLAVLSDSQRRLYASLTILRRRLAKDLGVPAYHVLTDRLILTIAEVQPPSDDLLRAIPGLGSVRARAYGAEILAVVQNHQRKIP